MSIPEAPRRSRCRPAATVLLAVLAVACTPDRPTPSSSTPEVAPDPGPPAPGEEVRVSVARLGRGGTVASALRELDVPSETAARVIDALAAEIDLRRLSPDSGLAVARRPDGMMASVACRTGPDHFLRVTLGAEAGPEVERLEVPVRTAIETAGGIVETTVADALADYPDSTTLTLAFADIFQWDVDLFVDPRPGDRVRLIYEARHLGRPPADLPPFGDSGRSEGASLGPGRVLAASYEGRVADAVAFWVEDDGHGGDYYDERGRSLRKTFLKSPLNYRRISSRFSQARRHPITRLVVPHHGVDFVAAPGTPVVAAADGRVVSAGWDGPLGRAIRIRHGNGYETVYGHLRAFARGIRRGAAVRQGEVIGFVGSTGRATGPHLHYSMLHHGRAIDPLKLDNPPAEPLGEAYRPHLDRVRASLAPVLDAIELESGVARGAPPHPPGNVSESSREPCRAGAGPAQG